MSEHFERRMRLDGRVALVTGGAGGIGSTAVDALSSLGASVAIADADEARCDAIVARHKAAGRNTVAFIVNLEQEAEVRALPAKVAARFDDRLDIIVNCAALVG